MIERSARYDRLILGEGVLGWVYEYFDSARVERADAVATGLEVGVQLEGEWFHRGSRSGASLVAPGQSYVISPAERYDIAFAAPRERSGLQVGFIVYPDEIEGMMPPDRELAFAPAAKFPTDRAFAEFCRDFRAAHDRGSPLKEAQARAEVLAFVHRRVEPTPVDPVVRAKREIDRTFVHPLYLEHIADVAAMKPRTFSRCFAARYGITPIAYRQHLRLNAAARLTWSAPELTSAAIAERVGFTDLPYFFRSFAKLFGTTPAAYGRRSRSVSRAA